MVGGQHEQVFVGQHLDPAGDDLVDLLEGTGEALEVVSMAVDLVGVD